MSKALGRPATAAAGKRYTHSNAPKGPQQNSQTKLDLDDLESCVGFLISRARIWVFQDFIKQLAKLDIRPADNAILSAINSNPGLNQVALSVALRIDRARLARLLHRLEDRMLVTRLASVPDKRSHALFLTDHGRKIFASARVQITEQEKRLEKMLGSKHYEEIRRGLLKISRQLASREGACP